MYWSRFGSIAREEVAEEEEEEEGTGAQMWASWLWLRALLAQEGEDPWGP